MADLQREAALELTQAQAAVHTVLGRPLKLSAGVELSVAGPRCFGFVPQSVKCDSNRSKLASAFTHFRTGRSSSSLQASA